MANLLESETTIAIVLGASDWTRAGLGRAKSFHKSAAYFHRYLYGQRPYGLALHPDLVLSLFDDGAPAASQLEHIKDFVRDIVLDRKASQYPIADILIYYIGHGTCDDGGTLHLMVRHTVNGIEAQSSISTPDLARVLKVSAPQQRRVCIFDCCFSEAALDAFGAMGPLDETVTKIGALNLVADSPNPQRGTMLFCSSSRSSSSIGLPDAERTLFTGALLQVLQQGKDFNNPMLSFFDLKDEVYEVMLRQHTGSAVPRPALHQPNQQDGDLTRLPAFPNVREMTKPVAETPVNQLVEGRLPEEVRAAADPRRQEEELAAAELQRQEEERAAAELRRHVEERALAESIRQEKQALAELQLLKQKRTAADNQRREEQLAKAEAIRREVERAEAKFQRLEDERAAAEAQRLEAEQAAAEVQRLEGTQAAAEIKRNTDVRKGEHRIALIKKSLLVVLVPVIVLGFPFAVDYITSKFSTIKPVATDNLSTFFSSVGSP